MTDVDAANQIPAPTATSVLEYLVRALVEDPDAVTVEAVPGRRRGVTLEVRTAPGDLGRVIGKRGRTAQSIRAVVRAAASRDGVEVDVDFADWCLGFASDSLRSAMQSVCYGAALRRRRTWRCARLKMLLEVGRIARAHGLRGEVVVELVTDRTERVAPGAELCVNGSPLTVDASRPHQGRFIVAFAGVDDRTAAEALVGSVLSAEGVEDDDALWVHELIGSTVRETDGTERGRVVSVQANPAHDQLVLDSGAMVPAVFVVSCSDGVIVIDPPAGLFE